MNNEFRYKVLFIFYLVGFVLMTGMVLTTYTSEDSTALVYNLLYLFTSLFLSSYFYTVFQARSKKIVSVIAGLVTLLYYALNTEAVYFDSIGHVIASTGIVMLIFLYLHQILNNVNEEPLSLNVDFWFVCVQLAYHLGSFAIFLSYNHFTHRYLLERAESKQIGTILTYLWVVHNVILFLSALIMSSGIVWIYRKKSRLS